MCRDIRRCDMVGRIDTNTFVVLFPSNDGDGAAIAMDRLKGNMADFQARHAPTITFAITMNAVSLTPGGDHTGHKTLEETLHKLKTGDGLVWSFTTGALN